MPRALADNVTVLGIPNARFWPDTQGEALLREAMRALEPNVRRRILPTVPMAAFPLRIFWQSRAAARTVHSRRTALWLVR